MGVCIYRQRIYLCRREKNDKDTARLALQWENVNSRQQWKEIFSSHYTNTWLAGLFRSRCTPLPTCWRVRSIQWSCMAERALWKVCPKRDFRQWGSPSFRLFSDSDLASHKTPLGLEFFFFRSPSRCLWSTCCGLCLLRDSGEGTGKASWDLCRVAWAWGAGAPMLSRGVRPPGRLL